MVIQLGSFKIIFCREYIRSVEGWGEKQLLRPTPLQTQEMAHPVSTLSHGTGCNPTTGPLFPSASNSLWVSSTLYQGVEAYWACISYGSDPQSAESNGSLSIKAVSLESSPTMMRNLLNTLLRRSTF